MKLYDEDGIDGPAAKAWKAAEREDRDARAFRDGAGAIEALIESDIDLVPQHAPKRGSGLSACGVVGQVAGMGVGVTCPACKLIQARNAARRAARRSR